MLVELSARGQRYIFKNQIIIVSVEIAGIFQKYSWIVQEQDAEINVCVFFLSTYIHHISPSLVPIHLKMYFKNFQLFPELQFLQIFKEHCEIAVFFRHKACRQTCLTFHSNFPSSSKEQEQGTPALLTQAERNFLSNDKFQAFLTLF